MGAKSEIAMLYAHTPSFGEAAQFRREAQGSRAVRSALSGQGRAAPCQCASHHFDSWPCARLDSGA